MKRILIAGLSIFFLLGCQEKEKKQEEAVDLTEDVIEITEEHADPEGPLELNQGQKWLVNDEMKPYVESGRNLVGNYLESGDSDYQDLAKKLTEQNNLLIKSCTMEGTAHDELHKWLHPHLELVASLKESTSPEEAEILVNQLNESYEVYEDYFQ